MAFYPTKFYQLSNNIHPGIGPSYLRRKAELKKKKYLNILHRWVLSQLLHPTRVRKQDVADPLRVQIPEPHFMVRRLDDHVMEPEPPHGAFPRADGLLVLRYGRRRLAPQRWEKVLDRSWGAIFWKNNNRKTLYQNSCTEHKSYASICSRKMKKKCSSFGQESLMPIQNWGRRELLKSVSYNTPWVDTLVNADNKDRTMQCINKTRHGTTVAWNINYTKLTLFTMANDGKVI